MNNGNLKKHVLITGGTSGIGKELGKLFAADGYNLILVARGLNGLAATRMELAAEYNVEIITINKDLFLPNSAEELYKEVCERNIFVDVLVNDAGQGQYGLFAKSDLRRIHEIIQLNVVSLTTLTRLFLKDMLAHEKGKILQLGAIASEMPGPWQAVYHATKAFVLSLSEGVRQEIKGTGVTITVLESGPTDTDFFRRAGMLDSKIMNSKLRDPAAVAKDGYEALHQGKDKIISGLKNKLDVASGHILPDSTNAARMGEMQEPQEEKKSKY